MSGLWGAGEGGSYGTVEALLSSAESFSHRRERQRCEEGTSRLSTRVAAHNTFAITFAQTPFPPRSHTERSAAGRFEDEG